MAAFFESDCPIVDEVARQIVPICRPQKIFLFNRKMSLGGNTASFKLCVVLSEEEKESAEKRIYLEICCDIPFDVLLYTPTQWESALKEPGSFANHILQTGRIVYEQKK